MRKTQVSPAADGTTSWIWNHAVYLRFATEHSGILWIRGKPGSGKSVLARSIQRKLLDASCNMGQPANPTLIGDWFYHRRRGGEYVRHESFVRSVLYHLLEQRPLLFDQFFRNAYRSMDPRRAPPWTYDLLVDILITICQSAIRIICVVDAVDEAESAEVISLIQSLIGLDGRSNTKFIILSRPNVQIERRIDAAPAIVVEDENAGDIERIVNFGLSSLQKAIHSLDFSKPAPLGRPNRMSRRPNMRQPRLRTLPATVGREKQALSEIREILVSKSQGSILWVKLLLDKLIHEAKTNEGATIEEMRQIVNQVPEELSDYYLQIVEELTNQKSPQRVHEIRQALMWICCAAEIGDVTLDGVWEALAVLKDDMKSDQLDNIWQKQILVNSYDELWRKISSICGPFVEIFNPGLSAEESRTYHYGPSSIIQLMHQSVRDFLCDQRTPHALHFSLENARQLVGDRLQHYLTLSISDYRYMVSMVEYQDPQIVVPWLDDQRLLGLAIEADKKRLEMKPKDLRSTRQWSLKAAPQATPEQILVRALKDYPRCTLGSQENLEDDIVAIGRIFYHCFTEGRITAVRNIMALGWVTAEEAASTLGDVIVCSTILVASISGSARVHVELDLYENKAATDAFQPGFSGPVNLATRNTTPVVPSRLRHCISSADLPPDSTSENEDFEVATAVPQMNQKSLVGVGNRLYHSRLDEVNVARLGLEEASGPNNFQEHQYDVATRFHGNDSNAEENLEYSNVDDDLAESDYSTSRVANYGPALSDYMQPSTPIDNSSQMPYSGQTRDDIGDTNSINWRSMSRAEKYPQRPERNLTTEIPSDDEIMSGVPPTAVDLATSLNSLTARNEASIFQTRDSDESQEQEKQEAQEPIIASPRMGASEWVTCPWTVVLKIDTGDIPQERRITFKEWFPFLDAVCGSRRLKAEGEFLLEDESDQEDESLAAHIEDVEDAIIAAMDVFRQVVR